MLSRWTALVAAMLLASCGKQTGLEKHQDVTKPGSRETDHYMIVPVATSQHRIICIPTRIKPLIYHSQQGSRWTDSGPRQGTPENLATRVSGAILFSGSV